MLPIDGKICNDDEFKNERIRLKQIFNQCSSVINSEFTRDKYQLDCGESYYTDIDAQQTVIAAELQRR